MFKQLGKQFASEMADKVEALTLDALNKRNPQEVYTEQTTENLHKINGKRKALFIGINYVGQKGELKGCVNDVVNIKNFFEKNYQLDEKMILTDDPRTEPETNYAPTKANIISGFRWLVKGAKPGDSLLLHYSGHGSKVKNHDGTEKSGYDQTLVPVDHEKKGHILDDDIHDMLCKTLPSGVRLTGIFDCCHSESIMDLPFVYNIKGNLEIVENDRNQSIATLVAAGTRFLMDGNKKQITKTLKNEIKGLVMGGGKDGRSNEARNKVIKANTTKADIIMFSGCKDDQTSADTRVDGEASGAMSYAAYPNPQKLQKAPSDLHAASAGDARDPRGQVLAGSHAECGEEAGSERSV
eukprot:CAMPEP_0197174868 /NCGR_PEP_ID=MMETSP1423-20130617/1226_1 /TAXON_ID=476441 /ORGANISM="Pseudo-nitzschia heimii, Strain UNC1101" /LENGTH=352 /DNA_ID=CAMNT_0042623869 /DNA_START=131 /DNA_END=1188 /DNA_ORIENTATION=+